MENTQNRDPKLCHDAIRDFWNRERELIKEGKGTRDWTLQQQIEIMNFKPGRGGERKDANAPTDVNGKAYEGHHMKSAEAYPQYQGRGDNIQALTRDEHLAAHAGGFHKPTNGYYNPETGATTEFGDAEPAQPEPVELSQPYIETVEYKYIIAGEVESAPDCGIG